MFWNSHTNLKYFWSYTSFMIDWLIDWCLTPTLAIFQLYRGIIQVLKIKEEIIIIIIIIIINSLFIEGLYTVS